MLNYIMKAHLTVFALTAILFASIGMAPAFGQLTDDMSVSVTTDRPSYAEGETILVTGEVRDLYSGIPVSVIIKAPNGNLVSIAQVTVGADKKFSTEATAGGSLMKVEGTYIIAVQYGTPNRSAETTFEFGATSVIPPTPVDNTGITDTTVSMGAGHALIGYEIIGGKILGITPSVQNNSLIVSIDATSDGSLTLTIPRSVLDANDEFFILVDEGEVDFEETTSSTDRILTIAFPVGAEKIEIIGTFVIPEFGTIAAMILVVAIVSIIAISAKSRLSIVPSITSR